MTQMAQIVISRPAQIGLFARKGRKNKQVAKNINNGKLNQANGSITINGKEDGHEPRD